MDRRQTEWSYSPLKSSPFRSDFIPRRIQAGLIPFGCLVSPFGCLEEYRVCGASHSCWVGRIDCGVLIGIGVGVGVRQGVLLNRCCN